MGRFQSNNFFYIKLIIIPTHFPTIAYYLTVIARTFTKWLMSLYINLNHTKVIISLLTTVRFGDVYRHQRTGSSLHYIDVIMITVMSQITGVSIVCSAVCSGADQRHIKAPRHWPLVSGGFPSQRASNAEDVSIRRCHHDFSQLVSPLLPTSCSLN